MEVSVSATTVISPVKAAESAQATSEMSIDAVDDGSRSGNDSDLQGDKEDDDDDKEDQDQQQRLQRPNDHAAGCRQRQHRVAGDPRREAAIELAVEVGLELRLADPLAAVGIDGRRVAPLQRLRAGAKAQHH